MSERERARLHDSVAYRIDDIVKRNRTSERNKKSIPISTEYFNFNIIAAQAL